MARAFVVVGESAPIMTDLDRFLFEIEEMHRCSLRRDDADLLLAKNRIERILRKHVLDVGDEQFLVLLLVMNAQD